jgi:cytochrome c5
MRSLREALLLVLVLASCAHTKAPVATDADAERAQARWPGITVAELNHGRKVYVGHCGGCHLPPAPTDHDVESWPGHVREMSERSGLTGEEESAVIRYLQVMAAAPPKP